MFPEFATTYRDEEGKVHLYIFPGIDDNGNQLYKNINLSSINVAYTHSNKSDNSCEIVFEDNIKSLQCTMIHSKTGEKKVFNFEKV